jgi:integrase
VPRNVAKLADPPRVPRRPVHPLDVDEVRTFLRTIEGDRLEALYLAAIGTGLRQGELLGLAWHVVDLKAATLTVRHALQRSRASSSSSSPSRRVRTVVVDGRRAATVGDGQSARVALSEPYDQTWASASGIPPMRTTSSSSISPPIETSTHSVRRRSRSCGWRSTLLNAPRRH